MYFFIILFLFVFIYLLEFIILFFYRYIMWLCLEWVQIVIISYQLGVDIIVFVDIFLCMKEEEEGGVSLMLWDDGFFQWDEGF